MGIFTDPLIVGLIILNLVPMGILMVLRIIRSQQSSLPPSPSRARAPTRIHVASPEEATRWKILQKTEKVVHRPVIFISNFNGGHTDIGEQSGAVQGRLQREGENVREAVRENERGRFREVPFHSPLQEGLSSQGAIAVDAGRSRRPEIVVPARNAGGSAAVGGLPYSRKHAISTMTAVGGALAKEKEDREAACSSMRSRRPAGRFDLDADDILGRTLSPNTPLEFGVESLNSPVTPNLSG